jgi:hypothetical protein
MALYCEGTEDLLNRTMPLCLHERMLYVLLLDTLELVYVSRECSVLLGTESEIVLLIFLYLTASRISLSKSYAELHSQLTVDKSVCPHCKLPINLC